jgi:hypothetical protein
MEEKREPGKQPLVLTDFFRVLQTSTLFHTWINKILTKLRSFLQNIYSTTFIDFFKPLRKHTSSCHSNVAILPTRSLAAVRFTGNVTTKLLQKAPQQNCNHIPIIIIFIEVTKQVLNSVHK